MLGLPTGEPIGSVELEFKELPYFIVSRAKVRWDPSMGDVSEIAIARINDRGLVVNPEIGGDPSEPTRFTFVPWTNIVSLSITRAHQGGKGTEQA
jgi:hypothetical protein